MPDPASTKQTTADLVAIRARADDATPGPWLVSSDCEVGPEFLDADNKPTGLVDELFNPRLIPEDAKADAEFIAHAREDIPALLDALEALAAENERLRGIEERLLDTIMERCHVKNPGHHFRVHAEKTHVYELERILHGDANAGGGE